MEALPSSQILVMKAELTPFWGKFIYIYNIYICLDTGRALQILLGLGRRDGCYYRRILCVLSPHFFFITFLGTLFDIDIKLSGLLLNGRRSLAIAKSLSLIPIYCRVASLPPSSSLVSIL